MSESSMPAEIIFPPFLLARIYITFQEGESSENMPPDSKPEIVDKGSLGDVDFYVKSRKIEDAIVTIVLVDPSSKWIPRDKYFKKEYDVAVFRKLEEGLSQLEQEHEILKPQYEQLKQRGKITENTVTFYFFIPKEDNINYFLEGIFGLLNLAAGKIEDGNIKIVYPKPATTGLPEGYIITAKKSAEQRELVDPVWTLVWALTIARCFALKLKERYYDYLAIEGEVAKILDLSREHYMEIVKNIDVLREKKGDVISSLKELAVQLSGLRSSIEEDLTNAIANFINLKNSLSLIGEPSKFKEFSVAEVSYNAWTSLERKANTAFEMINNTYNAVRTAFELENLEKQTKIMQTQQEMLENSEESRQYLEYINLIVSASLIYDILSLLFKGQYIDMLITLLIIAVLLTIFMILEKQKRR